MFCWKVFGLLTIGDLIMSISIPNVVDVDPEDPAIAPYRGFKNMHPSLNIIAYTPFYDLLVGNFVHV